MLNAPLAVSLAVKHLIKPVATHLFPTATPDKKASRLCRSVITKNFRRVIKAAGRVALPLFGLGIKAIVSLSNMTAFKELK